MPQKITVGTMCFLGGLAAGALVASLAHEAEPPHTRTPPGQTVEVRSHPPTQSLAAREPPAFATPQERLAAFADLNALLRQKFSVPLLTGTEINEDFVKLYALTQEEVAHVKASLARAKKRIAELEAQHAVIVPNADNTYSITIPPFPEAGGAVRDDFLRSMQNVLGPDRAGVAQASAELDAPELGRFGLNETTIAIRPAKPGDRTVYTSGMSSSGPDNELLKTEVESTPAVFREYYPEIYQRMVKTGVWRQPPTP